ncbi:hypothetical protein ACEWPM_004455 [Roseovarius sp. S4756]|uniref:hypothetical protein n=1 Tax=Roseovarius maritimus TaxID=3342637 RepID=UPI0037271A55
MPQKDYPQTPDGRYFVSRGRLWRCTDPSLGDSERRAAIKALMRARRAVQLAKDDAAAEADARAGVDAAKRALGERGPVWWSDEAPDEGGFNPKNSSYADWWNALSKADRQRGS